mgnify:CR=1 FL=1
MCESEGYTAEADALSAGFIEQRDVIADDIQRQFGIHGVIDAAENHAGEHRAAACEKAALSAPRATLRTGTGSRISQLIATAEAVSSVVSSAEDLSSHSADKSCSTHTLP